MIPQAEQHQKRGKNVILILADDLGFGDIGCFGNTIVQTPNIDALAKTGVCLTQHYAEAPICAPSRAGLLTGRYHHRCGAVDVASNRGYDRIALPERTIADYFKDHNYVTGMAGKWHNGQHDLAYHPRSRGFDEFVGFLNGGMDYWDWNLEQNGQHLAADGRYLTDVFTQAGEEFIKKHRERPFFLYLAYNAPHRPMQAPAEVVQKYLANKGLTPNVATLYAMVEILDSGIGRICDLLRRLMIDDDTIVLLTSDNGPLLAGDFLRYNGPFRGNKTDVLEGGIRVPAILRVPGFSTAGTEFSEMVSGVDWLPTLMELAGVGSFSPHLPLDGISIADALSGQTCSISRQRYWQFNRYEPVPRCNGAMRDGPWKLCFPWRTGCNWKGEEDNFWYQKGCLEPHRVMPVNSAAVPRPTLGDPLYPSLFHIENDPSESNDLSRFESRRVREMIKCWDFWWETTMQEYRAARACNIRA
ncbi:MAG: sulfatase-like hydrolase/transferase [Opitutales bacterium]|nr:sulfatase-like hydrolase/transferase [Opitutales bacterium]